MTEEKQIPMGYGYQSDNMNFAGVRFGLNERAKIVGFSFNPYAGKDGAAQEALELNILFQEEDEPRRMRVYPTKDVKYKDKNGNERILENIQSCKTNDERATFQKAMNRVSGVITHIMKCYMPDDKYKAQIQSRPISSFKDIIMACGSMLPKNFKQIEIDVFMEYQWKTSVNAEGQEVIYLQFPSSTISGNFLCTHVSYKKPWVLHKNPHAQEFETALYYTTEDENGIEIQHPFKRNGRFMGSNSAKGLKERNNELDTESAVSNAANTSGEQQASW
jgi:hypothetical protein